MPAKYKYEKLKKGEIRLLELLHDRPLLAGKIHSYTIPALVHDTLPATPISRDESFMGVKPIPPQYNALSHHWDQRSDRDHSTIEIKVGDKSYDLAIRPSLREALETIRRKIVKYEQSHQKSGVAHASNADSHKWSRFLWIDAICIDQNDTDDKDKQIPSMGLIYNNAAQVIVWLGNNDDDSQTAFDFVKELDEAQEFGKYVADEKHKEKWKSLALLTRRRWFSRLWIVQEISAARDAILICGEDELPWDSFACAVSLFASQNDNIRDMLRRAGETGRTREWLGELDKSTAKVLVTARDAVLRKKADGTIGERLKTLQALLSSLSVFEVSEAHDVVYAILWLSSDACPDGVEIHEWEANTPKPSPDNKQNDYVHENGNIVDREQRRPQSTPDLRVAPPKSYDTDRLQVPKVVGAVPSPPMLSPSPLLGEGFIGRKRKLSETLIPEEFANISAERVEQKMQKRRNNKAPKIEVSYSQPVYDLCEQVLVHIFEMSKSLDQLCYPWAPEPRQRDLRSKPPRPTDEPEHPSWLVTRDTRSAFAVASYNQDPAQKLLIREHADPLVGQPGVSPPPYKACGRTRPQVKIEDRCLHTVGHDLGEIKTLCDAANGGVIPYSWRQMVNWKDPSTKPPDEFWKTLVANHGSSDFNLPPAYFRNACKKAFQTLTPRGPLNLEKLRDNGASDPYLKEFLNRAMAVVWGRRLFRATNGRDPYGFIGLAPEAARCDDHVCVLWGLSVPVVLRPRTPKEPSPNSTPSPSSRNGLTIQIEGRPPVEDYEFIGECYVDGKMNGEALRYADHCNRPKQDMYIW